MPCYQWDQPSDDACRLRDSHGKTETSTQKQHACIAAKNSYQNRRLMDEREGKQLGLFKKDRKMGYLKAEEASSGAQDLSQKGFDIQIRDPQGPSSLHSLRVHGRWRGRQSTCGSFSDRPRRRRWPPSSWPSNKDR